MSAAERLRALEVESKEDHGWDSGPFDISSRDVGESLLDALPQIVAVVALAEKFQPPHTWQHDEAGPLRDALAALEEALPS